MCKEVKRIPYNTLSHTKEVCETLTKDEAPLRRRDNISPHMLVFKIELSVSASELVAASGDNYTCNSLLVLMMMYWLLLPAIILF